jgi:hypothetical protein
MTLRLFAVFAAGLGLLAPATRAEDPAQEKPTAGGGHVFAWPFIEWEKMVPRGGTTRGSEVTLRTEPKQAWQKLQEAGIDKLERDRRAIRAMAGSYRVSFDFLETLGFSAGYQPPRPYFSWGTEHVVILEDRPDFISLQHSLVMYFQNEQGETEGPFVMKHWRQDWTHEDQEIHTYQGSLTWQRERSAQPAGRWSQAVFQVDDSPRYEVMGEWRHEGGLSTWRSDNAPRPLPRREFSVRDDYNVLEGVHEITLSPTGWLHVQNNRKLRIEKDGSPTYVGMEIGVSRYEEITTPDLASAWDTYFARTGDYWKAVREKWSEVLSENDRFTLLPEVNGRKLFEVHFGHAGELEAEDAAVPAAQSTSHARDTIDSFIKSHDQLPKREGSY